MITIDIPNFGSVDLKYLVTDYSGTLSIDGILVEGIKERLNKLAESLEIHVITADTHGKVQSQLSGVNCKVASLKSNLNSHDIQKAEYIKQLGSQSVIAFGNGNNDKIMLASAKIGVAVCLDEGCSTEAIQSANILVNSAENALDLLLYPNRLKATLRC